MHVWPVDPAGEVGGLVHVHFGRSGRVAVVGPHPLDAVVVVVVVAALAHGGAVQHFGFFAIK